MLDTTDNINDTIKELHDLFSTIDQSEFENMDFSYLDDDNENI